jgi:hypothetical protein
MLNDERKGEVRVFIARERERREREKREREREREVAVLGKTRRFHGLPCLGGNWTPFPVPCSTWMGWARVHPLDSDVGFSA